MCNCNYSPCNCTNGNYSYNWYNTANYPCNPCTTTTVCKKTVPSKCILYGGVDLTNLGLTSPANVELILSTINIVLGEMKDEAVVVTSEQAQKNNNILAALNDINSRLNALESGTHAPYVI